MNMKFLSCCMPVVRAFVAFVLCMTWPPASAADLADDAERQRWDAVTKHLADDHVDVNASQADGMTAVHWAAFHNRAVVIKSLVDAGGNVNAVNEYQVSPLSLACEYGCEDAVAALIRHDADVSATRLGKETPLMLAARTGNAAIVRALVKHGANVNAKEVGGQTALMWAAAAGNLDAVDALIQGDARLDDRLPKSDFSAIMFAARHGRTDVVMRLLDAGLDVNAVMNPSRSGGRDPRKRTSALMLAVESGHLELAIKLIQRGADPNDQRSGYAPLHAITWVRRTELGDDPAGDPAPRITGSLNTLDFVRAIVAAGADVNLQLKNGTPRGARLNPKGATPFLLASRGADLPLMELLLELGADPSITNADGTTALMAAAGVGVIAVGEEPGTPEEVNLAIRKLVDLGLDPNVVDRKGETAMHGAALRTFPTTVAVLAEVGADPAIWNQENKRGWTPHEIAAGQRPGSVKPSPPTIAALDAALKVQRVSKPNVVVILVDDMGYGDPGCFNPKSKIPTPNIDRIARDGMRFTDAHAPGPLCHMSRYGLMTGQYPFRIDVSVWPRKPLIQQDQWTIASLAKFAGYRTAMVGKWHLGFNEEGYDTPLRGGPVDRGFDDFFGIRASTDIPPYFYIRNDRAVEPPTQHIDANHSDGWSPIQGAFWRAGGIAADLQLHDVLERFTDEATQVIADHAADKTTADESAKRPLMLYLAYPAPHTPWLPSKEFAGKSGAGMYGDFLMMVDAQIGRVLTTLHDSGMDDDTLLVFTSDNGPTWYDADVDRFGHDSAGGFRGMKSDAWEAGHRMPLIVRWPGRVKAGSTSDQLVCFTDFLATFADVLNVTLPTAAGSDSISFLQALTGDKRNAAQARTQFVMQAGSAASMMMIREGDWKLITGLGSGGFSKPTLVQPKPDGVTGQLYNLRRDPAEQHNLYAQHPEIVDRLRASLEQCVRSGHNRSKRER